MAGRYVLLEFDDPDSANAFVQNNHVPHHLGFKIAAMFVKPVKFCECPDKTRQNANNWRKGRRTGLYLCVRCGRPSTHHQTGIFKRLQYVFGYNLLEER